MKKKAKKSGAGKRSKKRAETKDLSARKASAVRGGVISSYTAPALKQDALKAAAPIKSFDTFNKF
ncbi:MAG TPA: hypothetical protein VE932_20820 [Patescibacteria group bacterium]|nr:hypothetical protein [Patescibacteria group bacterium]